MCQGRDVSLFGSVSSLFVELINKINSLLFTLHFMWFSASEWMSMIHTLPGLGGFSSGLCSKYIHSASAQRLYITISGGGDWIVAITLQPPIPFIVYRIIGGVCWQQRGIKLGLVSSSYSTTCILKMLHLNNAGMLANIVKSLFWTFLQFCLFFKLNIIPPPTVFRVFFVYSNGITLGNVQAEALFFCSASLK